MKRRIPFFVIGISSCFMLPCFVPGYHTFDFKIATAALRPRNDTGSERFCLENGRFSFFAVIFCTVLLCTVFQTFRSGNRFVFKRFVPEIAPFSHKTHQICHCEEGAILAPDAAIFNGTICRPGTNYGCAGRNRTLKERESKQNEAANPLFCNRASLLFHAPVLRSGIPYL